MSDNCIVCHVRKRYKSYTHEYPYCSRTCARKFQSRTSLQEVKTGSQRINKTGSLSSIQIPVIKDGQMSTLPICRVTLAEDTRLSSSNALAKVSRLIDQMKQFRAKEHQSSTTLTHFSSGVARCGSRKRNSDLPISKTNLSAFSTAKSTIDRSVLSVPNGCLQCRIKRATRGFFCGRTCGSLATAKRPCIIKIPPHHDAFQDIKNQFQTSWKHPQKIFQKVVHVYKIFISKHLDSTYDAYRNTIELKSHFAQRGRNEGNEKRRWHGTNRACDIGENGNTQICNSTTCSLCAILRESFRKSACGQKTNWSRFGSGIYATSVSSKADDYSANTNPNSVSVKALLLCKVAIGQGFKTTTDDSTLTQPPVGYDSVLAEPGANLNYDEVVVYNEDAIRPAYLVLYEI